MREKYCWLSGGWKLVLERCEKKILLGLRLPELSNRVFVSYEHKGTVSLNDACTHALGFVKVSSYHLMN